MRARRTIAGNEAGRPGPPVYLRGHRRRRRRGAGPLEHPGDRAVVFGRGEQHAVRLSDGCPETVHRLGRLSLHILIEERQVADGDRLNLRSSGARRISASVKRRLMDASRRLPTRVAIRSVISVSCPAG